MLLSKNGNSGHMELTDIIADENIDIIQALKMLEKNNRQIIFVTAEDRLAATLTDGDIRRWLLKGGKLDTKVSSVANYSPHFILNSERKKADDYLSKFKIRALPVVDDNHKILDVVFLDTDIDVRSEKYNIPVVVMAGGKGTRLYPYTKILPKPLIPIGDIPISEHIVNQFHSNGCNDFYFIVNYKKNMIKAYFNEIERDYNIIYIDEDKPLGTGGGVRLLKGKISSTFILTNCDSIIQEDYSEILKVHKEKKNLVTMICSLRNYEVPYGVVEIGENGSIESMKEKPSMSYFTNTGTYIVEPEVIDTISPDTFIGFPDVIQNLKDAGKNVGVYPVNESSWLDMGQFDTMENMKQKLHIVE